MCHDHMNRSHVSQLSPQPWPPGTPREHIQQLAVTFMDSGEWAQQLPRAAPVNMAPTATCQHEAGLSINKGAEGGFCSLCQRTLWRLRKARFRPKKTLNRYKLL